MQEDKKMKKHFKGLSLLLAATTIAACGFSACGDSSLKNVSPETIVIKVRKAGFGTDWLYTLKAKFEEVYKEEGYKVKIMTPDNSIKDAAVIRELALGHKKTKVDLYITSGVTPEMVGVNGDYGVLVEDIYDDVYNQPAISYDGTEEDVKIIDKLSDDVDPYMKDSTGAVYAYNWAQTSGGLVVNTKALAKYGLEIPKTTNEMFDCFQQIYLGNEVNGNKSCYQTGIYPLTYIADGNGYAMCAMFSMIAQYDRDFFDKFWSFQKEDAEGAKLNLSDAECWALYEDPALLEMLKIAYQAFDLRIAAPGSLDNDVDQAQSQIMGGSDENAVFMFNGDWMLNEVKGDYKKFLHDIDFVNFPVVSAVGVRQFGAGTKYNLSDADCDKLLSYIIGLVDQNMDLEDIIADVQTNKGITLDEEDALAIAKTRGLSYSRGMEHVAYVTKGTPKKDIVMKFLRMMCSNDFGATFNEKANGASPYCPIENTTSPYKFVRNASKIPVNQYFSLVSLATGATGYRQQLKLNGLFISASHLCDYIYETSTATIYNEKNATLNGKTIQVYADAALAFINNEAAQVKKDWSKYLKNLK